MKFIAFLLLLTLAIPKWGTDFEAAKNEAKASHKLILLNFSGSDWCAPCIATRRDYFESDAFAAMAKDNLVLLNADFPRKKKNQLSEEQTRKNEALADIYNKNGDFPLTILMTPEGKVLKSWKGKPVAAVADWVKEVKAICDSRK